MSVDVLKNKFRKKRFREEILLACAHMGCEVLGIEFGIYTSNSYKGWRAGASGEGGLLEKVWRRRALEQVGSRGGELGTSGRKGG